MLIVVSAMGKTTNALEKLAKSYFDKTDDIEPIFEEIKQYHFSIINQLFENHNYAVYNDLNNAFVEIEWILEDEPVDGFDFIYDQMVSMGEIISSKIVGHYLNSIGLNTHWLDARSYIQTDNIYREARIDWYKTNLLIQKNIPSILEKSFAITQGFIGNTSENFTTTLGREGSDYSAAIFANCLNAESLTIWKDVPGVLNADPKLFEDCIKFEQLSYTEAIEMTYFGATVIHPKTIKPLQNKNIPLFVKPFLTPTESGTVIKDVIQNITTPIIIVKKNQLLLTLYTKDLSFITEKHLQNIFKAFADTYIKVNILQISALNFSASFDYQEDKFMLLRNLLTAEFDLRYNTELKLITIRHANEETINKHIDTDVYLEQRSRNTAQFILKDE